MPYSGKVFPKFIKNQLDGTAVIDWDTNTIKVMLLNSTADPSTNQETYDFIDDLSANQITGTGYTAGGATLGSCTVTLDTANNKIKVDAADPSWTTATFSGVRYAVFYKDTGTPATSPVISYIDFVADKSVENSTFGITLGADGIVSFSYS